MVDFILIQTFLIALALGAIIGLEREHAQYKKLTVSTYGGVRTFPLIALFGALSAYLGSIISIWLLIANTLIMGFLIVIAYYVSSLNNDQINSDISVKAKKIIGKEKKQKSRIKVLGVTSEIAGMLTYFLGVLVFLGEATLATVLAISIAIILYSRSAVHNFVKKLKQEELTSTLKFAVIAFVILPFLPNKGYGPFEMFNPYVIWLMVVFISGISLVGYILMKHFGERGIELTGIFGGLVSSTAVTTSFAEQSKRYKKILKPLMLGVILANSIMFVRVLIEVFAINRELFWMMLPALSILFVLSVIIAFIIWKNSSRIKKEVDLSSPFTIGPALKFGAFFALILALVKVANVYFPTNGVYLVSFLSGFADVDAITLSLSQLAKSEISLALAKRGILLATLTNVATKGGIAYLFGSKEFGKRILVLFSFLIVAGVLALLFL
jgi:uncharacterized membrane protein (DUF4010 family)